MEVLAPAVRDAGHAPVRGCAAGSSSSGTSAQGAAAGVRVGRDASRACGGGGSPPRCRASRAARRRGRSRCWPAWPAASRASVTSFVIRVREPSSAPLHRAARGQHHPRFEPRAGLAGVTVAEGNPHPLRAVAGFEPRESSGSAREGIAGGAAELTQPLSRTARRHLGEPAPRPRALDAGEDPREVDRRQGLALTGAGLAPRVDRPARGPSGVPGTQRERLFLGAGRVQPQLVGAHHGVMVPTRWPLGASSCAAPLRSRTGGS